MALSRLSSYGRWRQRLHHSIPYRSPSNPNIKSLDENQHSEVKARKHWLLIINGRTPECKTRSPHPAPKRVISSPWSRLKNTRNSSWMMDILWINLNLIELFSNFATYYNSKSSDVISHLLSAANKLQLDLRPATIWPAAWQQHQSTSNKEAKWKRNHFIKLYSRKFSSLFCLRP